MKYNVMIEPFDEGLEYVCETDTNSWPSNGKPKVFNTKEEAENEAKKWNTGGVVKCEEKHNEI